MHQLRRFDSKLRCGISHTCMISSNKSLEEPLAAALKG